MTRLSNCEIHCEQYHCQQRQTELMRSLSAMDKTQFTGRACREGEWTEVEIPLSQFLQTWKGRLVDSDEMMNPGRVMGFGISVAAGPHGDDGDFSLGLDWIRARRHHATF